MGYQEQVSGQTEDVAASVIDFLRTTQERARLLQQWAHERPDPTTAYYLNRFGTELELGTDAVLGCLAANGLHAVIWYDNRGTEQRGFLGQIGVVFNAQEPFSWHFRVGSGAPNGGANDMTLENIATFQVPTL